MYIIIKSFKQVVAKAQYITILEIVSIHVLFKINKKTIKKAAMLFSSFIDNNILTKYYRF